MVFVGFVDVQEEFVGWQKIVKGSHVKRSKGLLVTWVGCSAVFTPERKVAR